MWLCSIAKHLWYKELKKKTRETAAENADFTFKEIGEMFGVLTGIVLALAVCVIVLFTQWYSSANSEEVTVDYGVRGNVA